MKQNVKFFVTGDNHFGKKFGRYREYKDVENKLKQSQIDAFRNMLRKAEQEKCECFVVTGDLFDKTHGIAKSEIKKVVEMLCSFSGYVLVLPGNHDYYDEDSEIWRDFQRYLAAEMKGNVIFMNEFREYRLELGDDVVVFYPAFCDAEHAEQNNLGWIKNVADGVNAEVINIGVAHGAIAGLTPDLNGNYFLMKESELKSIPMDAWFIGHTHIPYPDNLDENEDKEGLTVFNAGAHVQPDLSTNTEGNGFIVTVDKVDGKARVLSKKYTSGLIKFFDIKIELMPNSATALRDAVEKAVESLGDESIVRLKLSGMVKPEEYYERAKICDEVCRRFIFYEVEDFDLHEEINRERIRKEFAETSFAAKLLESFLDDPAILQDAYKIIQESKGK